MAGSAGAAEPPAARPALAVERGLAAMDEGDAADALARAREALRVDLDDWRAVRLWLQAGDALGLTPLVEAQAWGLARRHGTLRVAHAWARVAGDHLPPSVLVEDIVQQGDPALAMLALSWRALRDGRPGLTADVLEGHPDPYATRLRLQALLDLSRDDEAAALATEALARYPEHPGVVAPVLAIEPRGPLRRVSRSARRTLSRRAQQIADPLLLWRLRRLWIDVDDLGEAAAVAERLDGVGEPARLPRGPRPPAELHALATRLAAAGPEAWTRELQDPERLTADELRVVGEALVDRLEARSDLDALRAVLPLIRARVDTAGLATTHAEALAHGGARDEALTIADRAVVLAAGPAHDDLGRLGRARHALEVASALAVRGRVKLDTGDALGAAVDLTLADRLVGTEAMGPLRRRALEQVGPLPALEPLPGEEIHPLDAALVVAADRGDAELARRIALVEAESGAVWDRRLARALEIAGVDDDPVVRAVLPMLLAPTARRASAWATALQEAEHVDAAFVAWSITRGLDGRAVGLTETWRGVGDLDDAADVIHDAWADADARPGRDDGPPEAGDPLPKLLIAGTDGPVDLADLRGRVLVLNFWASWCAPCKVELPALHRLTRDLQEQGVPVTLVAVSTDEDPGAWERALRRLDLPGATLAHGPVLGAALGVHSLPTTVLVDPEGILRQRQTGFDPEALPELAASIRALAPRAP